MLIVSACFYIDADLTQLLDGGDKEQTLSLQTNFKLYASKKIKNSLFYSSSECYILTSWKDVQSAKGG